jgi:Cu(I)/Ag(I) efflux system membrane fusion protein/cobalt-zinc-cadmium efflux system membrane fusion protein
MNARMLASLLAVAVLAALGGWMAASWLNGGGGPPGGGNASQGPCAGGAKPLYWKAPMDPTYVRDQPGQSPMGMDLVPVCPGSEGAGPDEEVRIRPSVVQSIGVRTTTAQRRDLTRHVRAVGRVAYDERRISHVHTKVQGWIEKLHVEYEGQAVRKGEPMIEVYSPDLVATQEELLVAQQYLDATGKREFADVRKGGAALLDATRERLELWDIPDRDIERLLDTGEIRKTLTLYAPSSGVVTHIMARQGMEVSANDNLYTIADLSRVWIYADIYEYEIGWVKEGQPARIELRGMPGTTYDAKVTYVYPFLDPATRTVRVRLELPNPDGILKPEMFANVVIDAAARKNVVAVPDETIIRSGKRNLAIVALGEGRFDPRPVELGLDSGDGWIEIRKGLQEGDVVVASGQFLIDSESSLQEAVQKLTASRDRTSEARAPDAPAEPGGDAPAQPAQDPPAAHDHEGHAMPMTDGQ